MKRKIIRCCTFEAETLVNGFHVYPGTIMGLVEDDDNIFYFLIPKLNYSNGYQEIFAKAIDILRFGIEPLNLSESNDVNKINLIKKGLDEFVSINLKMDLDEWCNLLSDHELQTEILNMSMSVVDILSDIHKLKDSLKETCNKCNGMRDELSKRGK